MADRDEKGRFLEGNQEGTKRVPYKLTEKWVEAFEEIINDDTFDHATYLTIEDIMILTNDKAYNDPLYIHEDTFRRWRNHDYKEDPLWNRFYGAYKKALILQKKNLFKGMLKDQYFGRRFRVAEQKYPEWKREDSHREAEEQQNKEHTVKVVTETKTYNINPNDPNSNIA